MAGMDGGAAGRRGELYGLMGDLPGRDRPISATTVDVEERGGYTLERLVLDLNGLEPVPAYFTRPTAARGLRPGEAPP